MSICSCFFDIFCAIGETSLEVQFIHCFCDRSHLSFLLLLSIMEMLQQTRFLAFPLALGMILASFVIAAPILFSVHRSFSSCPFLLPPLRSHFLQDPSSIGRLFCQASLWFLCCWRFSWHCFSLLLRPPSLLLPPYRTWLVCSGCSICF